MVPKGIKMLIKSLRNSSLWCRKQKTCRKEWRKVFCEFKSEQNFCLISLCSDLQLHASQATASQTFSQGIVCQWWEWQVLLTEPVLLDNKRALTHSVHNCVPFVCYGLEMYGNVFLEIASKTVNQEKLPLLWNVAQRTMTDNFADFTINSGMLHFYTYGNIYSMECVTS